MSCQKQENNKKTNKNDRKLSLDKLLSASTIQQTKNNIRSIVNAHTNNINYLNIINRTNTQSNLSKQSISSIKNNYGLNNLIGLNHQLGYNSIGNTQTSTNNQTQMNQLIDQIKTIKQPLNKLTQQSSLIVNNLQKIKTQTMNVFKQGKFLFYSFRQFIYQLIQVIHIVIYQGNQQVIINFYQSNKWKQWMGKVCQQIFQRGYHLYSNSKLLYDQMRAFCCQKILLNLIAFQNNLDDQLKATPCIQWQNQVKKIISHECNKYPQTSQVQINKKLQQIVNRNKINNFESDDYDLIDKTNILFKYKNNHDYTQQIMRFLNFVISLPQKTISNNKSVNLFTNFHIFFTNLFSIVYYRNQQNDMQYLNKQVLKDYQYSKFNSKDQQQIQYKQKVKSYTKIQIGAKIPLHTQIYSYDQIVSGNIQIKTKPVARVIDKWIEQLRDKILKSDKSVLQRIHRFKGEQPGQRTKLTQKQKQILMQKLQQQKLNLQQFDKKLRQNIQNISGKLISQLGNLTDITFMDQNQRSMGQFACKMQQASVQYSIQKLNFMIGALLRAVQRMKVQINKSKPYSFIGQQLKLNLITFKIGDLLRCKFTSKQQQVIRIFQLLLTMSQMNYNNIFKIIRIKNRLHLSTRDILINALFKNQVVVEIQLAINQIINHKQKFMDKFNHFLYQLKRAEMGATIQICNIWVNNCPKSQTFKKQILKQNQRKRKKRQNICAKAVFQFIQNKHKFQKLPFICKLCKIFYAGQKVIFQSVIFDQYPDPICGQCLSTRIQKNQRLKYIFGAQDKPSHIATYMNKFQIPSAIKQIFSIEQISKHDYMMMVPIQSRKINKFAIRKVQMKHTIFLVENYLTDDGKLEIKVKYQFIKQNSIQKQQKKFFSKYCLFTFNKQVQQKQVVLTKNNFNILLQKDFKKIQIYQSKNNKQLQCLYMNFGQQNILFPHYNNPQINIEQKLKNEINIQKIIENVKDSKEVLQLSSKSINNQLSNLPAGIRLKMNTVLKELYLNDNQLTNIQFVTYIHGLEIFAAKNNKIQTIPTMPVNIQVIDLAVNNIQRISGFNSQLNMCNKICGNQSIYQEDKKYKKLRVLKLCCNFISEIQNLEQVQNLRQLSLYNNKVKETKGLFILKKLIRLNLSKNPIQKIQNVEQLKQLEYLSLGNNNYMIGNTQINRLNDMDSLQNLKTLIMDCSNIKLQQNVKFPSKLKNLNLSKQINNVQFRQQQHNDNDSIKTVKLNITVDSP